MDRRGASRIDTDDMFLGGVPLVRQADARLAKREVTDRHRSNAVTNPVDCHSRSRRIRAHDELSIRVWSDGGRLLDRRRLFDWCRGRCDRLLRRDRRTLWLAWRYQTRRRDVGLFGVGLGSGLCLNRCRDRNWFVAGNSRRMLSIRTRWSTCVPTIASCLDSMD